VNPPADPPLFRLTRPPDGVDQALEEVQQVLNRYPLAAQACVRALVAEGRAFAETEEGQRWQARLRGSPLLGRLRTVWESVSEQAFTGEGPGVVPSVLIERLLQMATRADLEPLLSRFFEERV
jgi:hypothetical protein